MLIYNTPNGSPFLFLWFADLDWDWMNSNKNRPRKTESKPVLDKSTDLDLNPTPKNQSDKTR